MSDESVRRRTAIEAAALVVFGVVTLAVGAGFSLRAGAVGASGSGFALVELYTSEGCHSCPAADRVGIEIAREAAASGDEVIVLGFHVSYWDRFGWADRYSDDRANLRQALYNLEHGDRSAYTPQMFVNGLPGFVGSDGERARVEVRSSLETERLARIGIKSVDRDGDVLTVRYTVTGLEIVDPLLVVAVAEDGLSSDVTGGENEGKLLEHASTVRAFEEIRRPGKSGSVTVTLPAGIDAAKASVVVFVQSDRSRRVQDAKRVALPAG